MRRKKKADARLNWLWHARRKWSAQELAEFSAKLLADLLTAECDHRHSGEA